MNFLLKIIIGIGIGVLISQKQIKKIAENIKNN